MSNSDFRKRVEGHEVDFDPTAWGDMENMLEELKPIKSNRGYIKWWVLMTLLIVVPTLWITLVSPQGGVTKGNVTSSVTEEPAVSGISTSPTEEEVEKESDQGKGELTSAASVGQATSKALERKESVDHVLLEVYDDQLADGTSDSYKKTNNSNALNPNVFVEGNTDGVMVELLDEKSLNDGSISLASSSGRLQPPITLALGSSIDSLNSESKTKPIEVERDSMEIEGQKVTSETLKRVSFFSTLGMASTDVFGYRPPELRGAQVTIGVSYGLSKRVFLESYFSSTKLSLERVSTNGQAMKESLRYSSQHLLTGYRFLSTKLLDVYAYAGLGYGLFRSEGLYLPPNADLVLFEGGEDGVSKIISIDIGMRVRRKVTQKIDLELQYGLMLHGYFHNGSLIDNFSVRFYLKPW